MMISVMMSVKKKWHVLGLDGRRILTHKWVAWSDRQKWKKAMDDEHEGMLKMKVWKPVESRLGPANAKIITSTSAINKKANGTFIECKRIWAGWWSALLFHQYLLTCHQWINNKDHMALSIIFGWENELINEKGEFLCGNVSGGQPIYMKVPEGFKSYYPDSMCFKQAARAFLRELT